MARRSRSIRHKFTAAILLTSLVALLISGISMVFYNLENYRDNLLDELTTQASLLGRTNTAALQFDDKQAAQDYLALLGDQPKVLAAAIYNAKGGLFASYIHPDVDPHSLPKLPNADGSQVIDDNVVMFKRIVANNEILGTVYLRVHYRLYEKLLGNLGIALSVLALAMGIAILMSFWLQRSVTRPILAVTDLARQVVEHRDYSLRADKITNDEVGYLVDAFNAMLAEVEQRNDALEESNHKLTMHIAERQEAEKALRQSEQQVLQLNDELEHRVVERTVQLENANKELEAFSYSVSHDLRAPLRAIDGFSLALLEDYHELLDETGRDYLDRVRKSTQRMGVLIDDLLKLAKVSRAEIKLQENNLSEIAETILKELHENEPMRDVDIRICSGIKSWCDAHLLTIVLQNLLNNAWKYTSKLPKARIEFGLRQQEGQTVYFVEDNGAGFNMAYAGKLFGAFQRMHDDRDFPGTGVGLATVQRIISRHGGRIWAESEVDKGTVFYFTLPTSKVWPVSHPSGGSYEP